MLERCKELISPLRHSRLRGNDEKYQGMEFNDLNCYRKTWDNNMTALTKGFNGGLWAFRLVFAVVVAELAIVAGTVVGCFEEDICTDADTQAIKETMQGLATKSFALYAAEKGISSNNKKEEE